MPARAIRSIVSLLIVLHFFAIGTAVLSYSTPNFPASRLAIAANQPFQPYLQATFLNNSYRFFSPNPGSPSVLWLRIQHEDRTVRWRELPGEPAVLLREPYQRRLNLTVQLGLSLAPDPEHEGKRIISPFGQTCLESCVRRVAKEAASPVKSIGVYNLQHRVLVPAEARAGWRPIDPRTYLPVFLGAYRPSGERIDELKPDLVEQPIAQVLTGIAAVDVAPLVRRGSVSQAIDELSLPEAVGQFFLDHPELLHGPSADLRGRMDAILQPGGAR